MEIEAKVRVESLEGIKDKLLAMGARFREEEHNHDTYFIRKGEERATRRPGDFLLRIRKTGKKNFLTLKGLTEQTGAWEEYEVEISNPEEMTKILKRTGFTKLFTIVKDRTPGELNGFEVNLDRVRGMGNFLEVALQSENKQEARKRIMELLNRLGFKESEIEHRGYAAMFSQSMRREK